MTDNKITDNADDQLERNDSTATSEIPLANKVRNQLRNLRKALRESVNETCNSAMSAAGKFRRPSRESSPNPLQNFRQRAGSKDIFNCPGCTKPLAKPKLLPCAHTICSDCLKSLTEQSEFRCPVCKMNVPQGSFEENHIIQSLLDMYKKVVGEGGQCSNEGLVAGAHGTAMSICLQCREDLCDNCALHHTQTSLTASHDVVQHSKLNSGHFRALQRERKMFCTFHKGKALDIYCRNCKECVCSQCLVGDHQKHECTSIKEAANVERQKIKEALLLEEANVAEASTALARSNDELKKEMDLNITQVEQMVDNVADDLIHTFSRSVNTKRRELLYAINHFEKEQKSLLKKHKNSLTAHNAAVKSMQDLTSLIFQHGSAVEVMKHSENLQQKAAELKDQGQKLKDETWRRKVLFCQVEGEYIPKPNLIGSITQDKYPSPNS